MKRIILEWGVLLSVGMALALSILWGVSKFLDRSSYHFRISTSRSVGDDLHLLVGGGDLSLCDQFEADASGNVRPLIVNSRMLVPSDLLLTQPKQFTIPGLDLRSYRIAANGSVIWSLKLTLLIPIVGLLLIAEVLRRRLKGLRGRIDRTSSKDINMASGQSAPVPGAGELGPSRPP